MRRFICSAAICAVLCLTCLTVCRSETQLTAFSEVFAFDTWKRIYGIDTFDRADSRTINGVHWTIDGDLWIRHQGSSPQVDMLSLYSLHHPEQAGDTQLLDAFIASVEFGYVDPVDQAAVIAAQDTVSVIEANLLAAAQPEQLLQAGGTVFVCNTASAWYSISFLPDKQQFVVHVIFD